MLSPLKLDEVKVSTIISNRKCQLVNGNEKNSIIGEAWLKRDDVVLIHNEMEVTDDMNYPCYTSHGYKSIIFSNIWHKRFGHTGSMVIKKYL